MCGPGGGGPPPSPAPDAYLVGSQVVAHLASGESYSGELLPIYTFRGMPVIVIRAEQGEPFVIPLGRLLWLEGPIPP